MTTSTFATVVIAAADQTAAQADLPGHFTAGYSETGEAPATAYVDSGYWFSSEMDFIVNEKSWPKKVYFGDAQATLDSLGLKLVAEPVSEGQ